MIIPIQCYSMKALSALFHKWRQMLPTFVYVYSTPPAGITALSAEYPSLHPFALASWVAKYHQSVTRAQNNKLFSGTCLVAHSLQGIVDRADALSETVPGDPSVAACYSTIKYLAGEMTMPEPVPPPVSIHVPKYEIQRDLDVHLHRHHIWDRYVDKLHAMQPSPCPAESQVQNHITLRTAQSMTRDQLVEWTYKLSAPSITGAEWAVPNAIKA